MFANVQFGIFEIKHDFPTYLLRCVGQGETTSMLSLDLFIFETYVSRLFDSQEECCYLSRVVLTRENMSLKD
jgi:hypothetical protein